MSRALAAVSHHPSNAAPVALRLMRAATFLHMYRIRRTSPANSVHRVNAAATSRAAVLAANRKSSRLILASSSACAAADSQAATANECQLRNVALSVRRSTRLRKRAQARC
jgi:hypothetical protein